MVLKKIAKKIHADNERGSRASLIEELFYDFNRSRVEIYKMNFVRGIFFGLGSVLGGTVVIAVMVWILSLFVDFPGIGDTIQQLQSTLRSK